MPPLLPYSLTYYSPHHTVGGRARKGMGMAETFCTIRRSRINEKQNQFWHKNDKMPIPSQKKFERGPPKLLHTPFFLCRVNS